MIAQLERGSQVKCIWKTCLENTLNGIPTATTFRDKKPTEEPYCHLCSGTRNCKIGARCRQYNILREEEIPKDLKRSPQVTYPYTASEEEPVSIKF